MMNDRNIDVLIVGAGPTGLALACDLARRSVGFRIIDKEPAYFHGSKGKGLQPRTLEVFDDFGIVDTILANGKFHIPFRSYDGKTAVGDRDVHAGRYPTPSTPYASTLITPQWRVEEALRSLLERGGGKVRLGTELINFTQDDNSVAATLRSGATEETVHCSYLVACDGGKSFVRKFLEVPFEGETHKDERMYVGDVKLAGLDREAWHSWPHHPDGWLALWPLPSTVEYQFQAQIPVGEEREPSLELFQEIIEKRTDGMNIRLTDAPWLSLYRVNTRMVSQYRIGRVFLAGDAAHVHPPAGGQGMNTGIQDAYNLGWKLGCVLNGAPASLPDTYEEERLPVTAAVLGVSSRLYKSMLDDIEKDKQRDAVTLQLGITYKDMSLSKSVVNSELKLAAGDRAPDAPGTDAAGRPVRLFDLLRGPQFSLLRVNPTRPVNESLPSQVKIIDILAATSSRDTSSAATFIDSAGNFAETYGGQPDTLILVRPDGYLGWIGDDAQIADRQDLSSVLVYVKQ